MKYAYFPGCSLHSMAEEYNMATELVMEDLNVELREIPDWNCCGSTPAHTTSHLLPVALPARNLAIIEKEGLDVVAPCAACYNRFKAANKELNEDDDLKETVNEIIEMDYQANVEVLNLIEVFQNDDVMEILEEKVNVELKNIKPAVYYGCLLTRPPEVTEFDDAENPQSMDQIMEAIGAEPVEWTHKVECCGGSLVMARSEVVLKLSRDILKAAKQAGANCIVTACPLCHANLDMRQEQINKKFGDDFNMPIFYFTQLIGAALGHSKKNLGLKRHFIGSEGLLGSLVG
ncbi:MULTISPECIES: CoB--CoM heterodisulfide reductase iron-sulfur subunit B family protein [unclassified Candidatus Frackibacter]|uniref:CoB--CoM heterodisulfide reductase iron-sulfur subunit B family protein n=1 Tax=unclassified Candidatus Frackibacter TaxID=2648818 RepID=UPI00087FC0C2|nr:MULTISPECIES: CoB--CoM heterodisulfide reductase iron-sulfur subunit B family protein [unclassified Candidatus Frackibacter]SDC41617.1 heterodisulfide reductase subunit B [Candidatus Frackibacter sp. WG11]SEM59384.1 heterodisulfide reductase subunit B [Candidatus Frackibacter sp. WG12]SFL62687.1 heterodisulfide reductase subunit B [Candidatus Frackibacter sp. WG13]